jgi:hypothetical protein
VIDTVATERLVEVRKELKGAYDEIAILEIREAMRADYPVPEDFPPVERHGAYAFVDFGEGRVLKCPALDGSDDLVLNAFAWLKIVWPFRLASGKLVKTITKFRNGAASETNRYLHDIYAHLTHCDEEFDFVQIEAVDGDFLNWTPGNIQPVKDPNAPATDGQKKHAQSYDEFTNHDTRRFQKFIRVTPILDDNTKTKLSSDFVTYQKSHYANMRRSDVDRREVEQHQEFELPYPDFVPDPKGTAPPAKSTAAESYDENGENGLATLVEISSADEAIEDYDPNPPADTQDAHEHSLDARYFNAALARANLREKIDKTAYHNLSLEHFRMTLSNASSAENARGTERVLNFFGWRTPGNGRLPTYEGFEEVDDWRGVKAWPRR